MPGNPYLPDAANAVTSQVNNNLMNYQLPGINSGAMAAGGFGGSRQGVAQGLAIGQTNQGLSNSLASMSLNAWDSDQNRATQQAMQQAQLTQQQKQFEMGNQTQRYGMDQNYNLGMGGLGLQDKVSDQNFYNQNRSMDLSQYGLGANLAGQGNLGLSNQGQQLWQNGQQQQQAPWTQLGQFGSLAGQFSGLNQSQSQSTPGASTVGSALGGALTAAQLWKLLRGG